MLNHFKKCTPSSSRSHAVCGTDNESNSSSSISSTSTTVRRVSGMNTLDNIVVNDLERKSEKICERTVTGVAAYHITLSRLNHWTTLLWLQF